MKKRLFLLSIVIFSGFFFLGSIFTWIDENGTKHYSNVTPPPGINADQLKESNSIYEKLSTKESKQQSFKVLKVYDGDTIKVEGLGFIFKIRLVGIDAPEIGYKGRKNQPFSRKAKSYLEDLVSGRSVQVKSYGIGGYNRQLAEVYIENRNVNLEMIKAGLAEVYKGKRPDALDSKTYIYEESEAKKNLTGMWIQSSSYKSPRQWRKEHPVK